MNDDRTKIKRIAGEYKAFSIRILGTTADKIESIALDSGRSRDEIINQLLDWSADRCDVI